jgi:uncharacterized protein with PIN domain
MNCECERCHRVVERPDRSIVKVTLYVLSYLSTLPFAWLLFVAGPGVVGVIPIVMALGFAGEMSLRPWVFPEQRCPHCKATLEYALALVDASVGERAPSQT